MLRGEGDDQVLLDAKQRSNDVHDGLGPLLHRALDGGSDLGVAMNWDRQDLDLHPHRHSLQEFDLREAARGLPVQHRDELQPGQRIAQALQPLGPQLVLRPRHPGRVATGPGEAPDQAISDRIDHAEHDRDG